MQLIFTARLATQNDYANLTIDTSSDDSDVEGDEDSTSVDPNKSRNGGAAVPIPFAHAPYFPIVALSEDMANEIGTQAALVGVSCRSTR